MAKQTINLKIAGRSYPFEIERGKEEIYRLAEREVNDYFTEIKKQNFTKWTDLDCISIAALKFAITDVAMRQSRHLGGEDVQRLEKLDEEIDSYLNTL